MKNKTKQINSPVDNDGCEATPCSTVVNADDVVVVPVVVVADTSDDVDDVVCSVVVGVTVVVDVIVTSVDIVGDDIIMLPGRVPFGGGIIIPFGRVPFGIIIPLPPGACVAERSMPSTNVDVKPLV